MSKLKRWRCTVCGYIHIGAEPPMNCPNCGSPREKFVEIVDKKSDESEGAENKDDEPEEAQKAEVASGTTHGAEAGAIQTGGPSEGVSQPKVIAPQEADKEVDVIVVGSGAAAYAAAVTAQKEGASVLMLEKGESPGGTTIRSGGGFWTPNNRHMRDKGIVDKREDALRYMVRHSFPHLYNPEAERYGAPKNEFELLETMVDNASDMVEYLEAAGVFTSVEQVNWRGEYQVDYQDHLPENNSIRGRCLFVANKNGEPGFGYTMMTYFFDYAKAHGLPMLLNHRVSKILREKDGKVIGVEAMTPEGTKRYLAKKGVIFGTGGYTHNDEFLLHFQRGPMYGGCSAPTNTGDFVYLATEIGAKLGNMNGAFRAQSVFENVLEMPEGSHNLYFIPGDSVLEVNRYGKRVMNEKRNYNDRSMLHFVWDPNRAEWTNMLLFMIFDERTRKLWGGFPPYPAEAGEVAHIISGDDYEKLSEAIAQRLKELKAHTGGFTLDEDFSKTFQQTIKQFNEYAKTGKDEEFARGEFAYDREWTTFPPLAKDAEWPPKDSANYTMYPLSDTGPYYCVILASSTLDTNGGPMINKHAQVLDVHDKVIEGLYGAGNCISSPAMNAYWGAGSTIGPALTFGYVAAKHVMGK